MRLLIGALLLTLPAPVARPAPSRSSSLEAVLSHPALRSASVGVEIRRLPHGDVVYSRGAEKSLRPASILKLVTTAAALDILGPNARIETTVETTATADASGHLAGDLLLVGRGDPTLGGRHWNTDTLSVMDDLVRQIAAAGIRHVRGRVVGHGGLFPGERRGSDWGWEDLVWWYGAEVSALSANDGCVRLRAAPGAHPGDLVSVVADPPSAYYRLAAPVTTSPRGTKAELTLTRPSGGNEIRLSGTMAAGDDPWEGWVALEDPALFAATLLAERMAAAGIAVVGGAATSVDASPSGARVVASRLSPTVAEMVRTVNKESHNLGAESLFRLAGLGVGGDGTAAGGREAALSVLGRLGISEDAFVIADGSGLSRGDLATAAGIVSLLVAMDRHPSAAAFVDSLAVAGVDGTLKGRMRGTAAEGRVRAKTGTIRHTATLAGYVTTRQGERLAFAVIVNNPRSIADANRAMDALAVALAGW